MSIRDFFERHKKILPLTFEQQSSYTNKHLNSYYTDRLIEIEEQNWFAQIGEQKMENLE